MPGQLCPKCGHFTLEPELGYLNETGVYVCSFCGARIPVEEITVSLDPDSMQRFPTDKDATAEDSLSSFLKKKGKQ